MPARGPRGDLPRESARPACITTQVPHDDEHHRFDALRNPAAPTSRHQLEERRDGAALGSRGLCGNREARPTRHRVTSISGCERRTWITTTTTMQRCRRLDNLNSPLPLTSTTGGTLSLKASHSSLSTIAFPVGRGFAISRSGQRPRPPGAAISFWSVFERLTGRRCSPAALAETVLRDRPEYQVRGCRASPRPGSPARMSGPR